MYEYKAELVRVIDGDTVVLRVDVGFDIHVQKHFRLLGIDTPELRGGTADEKIHGHAAKAALEGLLTSVAQLRVVTSKPDSFGRWLCTLWSGATDINQWMIDEGHAVPYVGR